MRGEENFGKSIKAVHFPNHGVLSRPIWFLLTLFLYRIGDQGLTVRLLIDFHFSSIITFITSETLGLIPDPSELL